MLAYQLQPSQDQTPLRVTVPVGRVPAPRLSVESIRQAGGGAAQWVPVPAPKQASAAARVPGGAQAVSAAALLDVVGSRASGAVSSGKERHPWFQDHLGDGAMTMLNCGRKQTAREFEHTFQTYMPAVPGERVGGDLDDPDTLLRAVRASAADGEVMLLCVGGSGSMRTGLNLVLNFRSMGLYHMLILALEKEVCISLWDAMPSLACVWWPGRLSAPRPASLYNTMFNKVALAFFEARKVLLERLVLTHRLNVLHLDADTIWFANPYPIFKTIYRDYSLIVQTDNPFVNAGVLYVQNVQPGDSAAWVLQELNRRIDQFTYHPETVALLPHSGWSTQPHFANADEQANLNDIVVSAVNGAASFTAGVEFYEARFKKEKGSAEAAKLMSDHTWTGRMQGEDVGRARGKLVTVRPDLRFEKVVHLCKMDLWKPVRSAPLRVPGNATAAPASLLLAPDWLFSHFPYGVFFPSFRKCHADSWRWKELSVLEQRLCSPGFRVPTVMVHFSGLRNGQWGRRNVMRALGFWHADADKVAPEAWVSIPTDRLLVAGPSLLAHGALSSMADFDAFAARLLLLGLLLGRRVVMPSLPQGASWAEEAIQPRHLRAIEVGCGPERQRAWLPMPHSKEPWCSGIDFIYDIDYKALVPTIPPEHVSHISASSLRLTEPAGASLLAMSSGGPLPDARVLVLNAPAGGNSAQPLDWLPIHDWKQNSWKGPFASRVHEALGAASIPNLRIVRDCMHSLATSKD